MNRLQKAPNNLRCSHHFLSSGIQGLLILENGPVALEICTKQNINKKHHTKECWPVMRSPLN